MKKSIKILLLISVSSMIAIGWYITDRFAYASPLNYFTLKQAPPDTAFTIGIVGDSWVSDHKLDTLLKVSLYEAGINANIISSGQGGAKTKTIYQNLFKDEAEVNTTRFVIEQQPQYCIVVAGVNDAIGQIGKAYYTHHMIQIIATLLHYNIKPVVVTLPEFDVVANNNEMNSFKKYRNVIFAYFTNNGNLYNIRDYRANFSSELAKSPFANEIILVNFDEVCGGAKDCPELYINSSHLSGRGNKKLVQQITTAIKSKLRQG